MDVVSLINPKCSAKPYAIRDQKYAEECGRYRGYMSGVIIALIITVIAVINLYNHPFVLFLVLGVVAVIVAISGSVGGVIAGKEWQVYEAKRKSYIDTGMSEEKARDAVINEALANERLVSLSHQ